MHLHSLARSGRQTGTAKAKKSLILNCRSTQRRLLTSSCGESSYFWHNINSIFGSHMARRWTYGRASPTNLHTIVRHWTPHTEGVEIVPLMTPTIKPSSSSQSHQMKNNYSINPKWLSIMMCLHFAEVWILVATKRPNHSDETTESLWWNERIIAMKRTNHSDETNES